MYCVLVILVFVGAVPRGRPKELEHLVDFYINNTPPLRGKIS
jgi:hypothetical protein